jgi:hypothetical protein
MLPQIHYLLVRQGAGVWALMHGSPVGGMGLVLTKAKQLTAIEARIRADLVGSATLEDVLKKYSRFLPGNDCSVFHLERRLAVSSCSLKPASRRPG